MTLSGEVIAVATASFLLGWTLKNTPIVQLLKRGVSSRIQTKNIKLALVVRTDLSMSKGKIASQCSHATLACYRRSLMVYPDIIKQWETLGETKIVLRTDSGEAGLRELEKKASNAGLVTRIIRDMGRTEVVSGTATVLGIGPDCASKINKVTSDLALL